MRHIVLADIAMKKWGAYERWLAQFCSAARTNDDQVDVWSREPMLPELRAHLEAAGVQLRLLDEWHSAGGGDVLIWTHFFGAGSPLVVREVVRHPGRVIVIDHASGWERPATFRRRASRAIIGALLRRRLGAYVAVSNFVAERARRVYRLQESTLRVIYNGVAVPPDYVPRASAERPIIVCVAQLIAEKGIDTLIQALSGCRDTPWRLAVIGEGPERAALEQLTLSLGLGERVSFVGRRDDVPERLQAADIAVHPARWQEAFGFTVAEAMGAGCALIATRAGGIPEIVEDQESGLLVEPGDVAGLGAALLRLLESPTLRASLGRSAHQRARRLFAIDRAAAEYIELGREVHGHAARSRQ